MDFIDEFGNSFSFEGGKVEVFYKTSTSIENIGSSLEIFELYQNYPNPFNPITTISYSIPKQSYVVIKIYDALGKDVRLLVNKELGTGKYQVEFDGTELSSGVYFYQLQAEGLLETKKFILLK